MFKVSVVDIKGGFLYKGLAETVLLPGVVGEFEIGVGHVPIASLLRRGAITIKLPHGYEGYVHGEIQRVEDLKGREYLAITIYQGLIRFDGEELLGVVEKGIV